MRDLFTDPYVFARRVTPKPYRALGSVPLARRVEVRHILREVQEVSRLLEQAMLHDQLSADGTQHDCRWMVDRLRAAEKLLA